MKKLFVFAAALLALASCSKNEEPQAIVETREISFAPAATETRATQANEITVANLTEFAVSGFVKANAGTYSNGTNNKIFDNVTVRTADQTVTTASIFSIVNNAEIEYWAELSDYKFSAVYPVPETFSYSYAWTTGTTFEQKITGFSIQNNHETPDLLVAKEATATTIAAQTTNTAVGLNFYHMLSRVKFSFQNTFVDDNISFEVSNIQLLDVTKKADATISLGTDGKLVATWAPNGSEVTNVNFYDSKNEVLINMPEAQTDTLASVYRLIIPQTASYKVAFDLVVKSEGNVIATVKFADVEDADHSAVVLNSTEFKNGQSYVFNAKVNENVLTNDLHPITFTVNVEPWANDFVADDDIFTPNN